MVARESAVITAGFHPPLAASQSPLTPFPPAAKTTPAPFAPPLPTRPALLGSRGGPKSVLPKRLRPQARVVGQPPHERRHLGRRQTGRTRKGYAASVSGKAANGCAVDGPREKIAAAGRSAQARTSMPPAGNGWPYLAAALMKRDALGETFGTGRARIPRSSLSAGAALVVNAGRRGRRPLQDGMSDGLCVRPVTEFPSPL